MFLLIKVLRLTRRSVLWTPVGLGVFSHGRETVLEELQRQIKELEKHELELSITLQRSQIDTYNHLTNTPTQIGTSQTAKTIPTQLGTQNALQSEKSDRCISVDTSRVNSTNNSHPIRKEKEPDKFDGRSVEWKDFIVHLNKSLHGIGGLMMNKVNNWLCV